MANEIFYCSRCQTRLLGTQFLEGTAFRVRDQISCENCLGEVIAPLSLEEQQEILLQVKALKDSQVLEELPEVAVNEEEFYELDTPEAAHNPEEFFELDTPEKRAARPARPAGVSSSHAAAEKESSQNRAVLLFLFSLAVIAGLGSYLYLASDPDRPVTVTGEKPFAPYNPTLKTYSGPTPTDPRLEEVRVLLSKAREFIAANPTDLAGQQESFKKAVDAAGPTGMANDTRKEYEQLLQKHRDVVAREFEPLDKETTASVHKEEFKQALDRLEQAKTRYNIGEWKGGVDLRMRNLRTGAWTTLKPLREKAVEAKQKKNDADVKAIVDRVAKWGMPEYSRDLESALGMGSTPAPTPATTDLSAPSEEAKVYEVRWRQAMEHAGQRDYDGAIAVLEKAATGLKEEGVKSTATADQDIVRKIQAIQREALQILSLWTRNDKIPLEFFDDNLNPERAEEPFLRADPEKVEVVKNGAPYPIELAELTARSLVNLIRKKKASLPEADARSAALLCLVEGDIDAARIHWTGPAEAIPYKYWALAPKIAESRSGITEAGKRESIARKTYFAAERGYADLKSRATAVQYYRELLNLYPDTTVVKRRRVRILARRDGAKDYAFLPDDMDVAGTFKSGKTPKFGDGWISNADSDPSRGASNFVNVKFYAFPDVTYQCWAYIGGCCVETFACFYQATDLTFPNPKGGEALKISPGSNNSLPVKHSITFLKPNHAAHGGPKEAKRWEWAEIKLPKYAEAGIKDVRVMTDQKGFGIAFLVVSAARTGPPNETEMKSWLKKPETVTAPTPEEPTPVVAAVVEARDPSLIGHWKLDESGASALDASGRDNSGILVNEPSRVPGKMGGAIALDGKERYVSIPNAELLDKVQEGTYTLTCWFKPNSKPGDANDPAYAVIAKSAAHEGITYNADQKFVMDHVLSTGMVVTAVSGTAFPPGNYYHVAGIVNRGEGSVRIFVNGKLEGSASYTASAAAKDFKNETWKIGIAAPGAPAQRLAADGIVDDVRLYNRAVLQGDLRTIAGIAGGSAPSIVITSPLPGEKFEVGGTVAISATATPADRIAKIEFYSGGTLLATRTSPPFTHTWNKVQGGTYTLTARATDRSGTVYTSAPLTIKVGTQTLYRALNLAGASTRIDGVDFEGKGAKGVSCNGTPVDLKLELTPPPDAALAPLLKSAMVHPLGTSVSLINIPNGPYQVYLYVCAGANPQTYDIAIAGRNVQSKILSGAPGTWQKLGPWAIDATGGLLEIAAKGGEVNFCALEVWKVAK